MSKIEEQPVIGTPNTSVSEAESSGAVRTININASNMALSADSRQLAILLPHHLDDIQAIRDCPGSFECQVGRLANSLFLHQREFFGNLRTVHSNDRLAAYSLFNKALELSGEDRLTLENADNPEALKVKLQTAIRDKFQEGGGHMLARFWDTIKEDIKALSPHNPLRTFVTYRADDFYSSMSDEEFERHVQAHERLIKEIRISSQERAGQAVDNGDRMTSQQIIALLEQVSDRESATESKDSTRSGFELSECLAEILATQSTENSGYRFRTRQAMGNSEYHTH